MSNYPFVGFHFRLSFPLVSGHIDTSFKEVSGLSLEMEMEEIAEGGENRFKHRVPSGAKYQNLVLKRGITSFDSPLSVWCESTLTGDLSTAIVTQTVLLSLLNEDGLAVKNWSFVNTWPVKWEISPLNTADNEILIETLELTYDYFKIV
ncbi:phage tail protein [Winogradskyella sp.]|uniref:phage tail protein n=1 Tax=Winogradskyella sp. TaxID=1883156 RepID=UPI0025F5A918|nr:phage tail protein [Winogradskyella sp.]